ncbi:MAG: glutamate 5-kinase [Candidatus Hydrogenedentota bacterium]|nr:MAG: glutamate 5-kinase [Candidatus Hydrogenedentota bacterium]
MKRIRKHLSPRRIVLKVGTRLLSDPRHRLDPKALARVVGEAATARKRGIDVLLVSSGAVGAGMGILGLDLPPSALVERQACAAIGQGELMHEYARLFRRRRICVAQILLTRQEMANRRSHQNIRRVLERLLHRGVLPIVNENDVVAADELQLGDNDTLAGLVADMIEADLLVILTDTDGLRMRRDGRWGKRIRVVTVITEEMRRAAGGAESKTGTGGMITKVRVAERMARAGRPTVIANGGTPNILRKVLAGEDVGTWFLPSPRRLVARKRWIADGLVPDGKVVVDAGAAEALLKRGSSLLPKGVVAVEGDFGEGAAVEIVDEAGAVLGQGLSRYDSRALARIRRRDSREIESILGYSRGDEVIHRNDLVIG